MYDSTTTTDPVLAVNANIPAPYIPYSEYDSGITRNRPGWKTNNHANQRPFRGPKPTFICHECYARGHVSPRCNLKVSERSVVIATYEALGEQERAAVPASSYYRAKAEFRSDETPIRENNVIPPVHPKHQPNPQRDERHPLSYGRRTPVESEPPTRTSLK